MHLADYVGTGTHILVELKTGYFGMFQRQEIVVLGKLGGKEYYKLQYDNWKTMWVDLDDMIVLGVIESENIQSRN